MNNIFQNVSGRRPQSSLFDLSHTRKFSFAPGKLYPVMLAEAVPSDVFNYNANALVRMMPMQAPLMHIVDVCMHSFFYPERLTQRRGAFEVFITGGKNGDGKDAQGNTIEIPYFMVSGTGSSDPTKFTSTEYLLPGSLSDYLGIQFGSALGSDLTPITARPFIAFWRIWCEYFRDPNLDPDYVELYPAIFDSVGGNLTASIWTAVNAGFPFFSIPNVCWEKDYFTSALPFAQRGEAVETPLSGSGTVVYKSVATVTGGAAGANNQALGVRDGTNNINRSTTGTFTSAGQDTGIENIDSITLSSGGFTINALRTAARLQEWLERMARGGARYIEQIKHEFGVTSRDSRLQRAEYLGGGKIPMHISEVLQTSENGTTPLAEMAGHGVTAGQITGYKKFVEEHGYLFTFIYLRPKTAYQQGLPRLWWNRFEKLEYLRPAFAHLGEQEVKTKEIYFRSSTVSDDDTFGYQQRYAEYKYMASTVHGEFRTTLDHWHWGRQFSGVPTLSPEFVHCDPDTRIFNVIDAGDSLYCIVNNHITAKRPLPYYGEPFL